jgi:hypothetical protein
MDAQLIFENILKQVMDSCLNYKLEMSPFSAVISLKKSFIRDKSGIPIFHSSSTPFPATPVPHESENQDTNLRISQLETAYSSLSINYEEEIMQSEATKKRTQGDYRKLRHRSQQACQGRADPRKLQTF